MALVWIARWLVLLVADRFHPVDNLPVEPSLNGHVRHRRCWRGAVPMFLTRREPDHITGPDFLDRPSPPLRPATASRHDQCLTERVRMPCGPRAGLRKLRWHLEHVRVRAPEIVDRSVPCP